MGGDFYATAMILFNLDTKTDRAFKNWCLRSRRIHVVTYSIALAT